MQNLDDLRNRLKKLDKGEVPLPQGMTVTRSRMVELTVKQLKAACEQNPEHPVAKDLKTMLAQHQDPRHDNHVIAMDAVDVEALLDNKEVVPTIVGDTQVDGAIMTEVRKVIGDVIQAEESKPAEPDARPAAPVPPAPENFDRPKTSDKK